MGSTPRSVSSTVQPALLARVAKGDQQAFEQLYDQSSSLLFTLAVKILGDRDEAAELLQEVYLEIWRKSLRFDAGRGTPTAWLVTVTRSRAIDRLRAGTARGHGRTDPLDAAAAAELKDDRPSPLDDRAGQELRTAVEKALADLPEDQQQAVMLAFYEGLSHTEIAARLNQPLGTVKTRIRLGMGKLKDDLRPWWDQG
ncbi:MAG: sigma-70 family RNA polymerase sigma factor [Nitrospirota bacterium]